jgi:hypothetical protein
MRPQDREPNGGQAADLGLDVGWEIAPIECSQRGCKQGHPRSILDRPSLGSDSPQQQPDNKHPFGWPELWGGVGQLSSPPLIAASHVDGGSAQVRRSGHDWRVLTGLCGHGLGVVVLKTYFEVVVDLLIP